MPDAMRGFLDQVGQLGSLPGMSGLGSSFAKAPAASLPAGARFEEYLYSNAAGTRAYKLYVPSDYNDQQSLPLVVMMRAARGSHRPNRQGRTDRFRRGCAIRQSRAASNG